MYTIELSLWERTQLDLCLPRNAPLGEIKQLLRIMDAVAMTEDEKALVDFTLVIAQTRSGPVNVPNWDVAKMDAATGYQSVGIESEDFAVLKKCIKDRQSWPTDIRAVELQEKINAAVEDS